MPNDIKIVLDSQVASDLAAAYAAQMQTGSDLIIAREQASLAWRLAEVARLDAARAAGTPVEVDYAAQPIHERDGSEVKMDEESMLLAAARNIETGGKSGGIVEAPEGGSAPADPVAEAAAAHEAAQAAYGALVAAAIEPHREAVAEVMAVQGSRFAVDVNDGSITATLKP